MARGLLLVRRRARRVGADVDDGDRPRRFAHAEAGILARRPAATREAAWGELVARPQEVRHHLVRHAPRGLARLGVQVRPERVAHVVGQHVLEVLESGCRAALRSQLRTARYAIWTGSRGTTRASSVNTCSSRRSSPARPRASSASPRRTPASFGGARSRLRFQDRRQRADRTGSGRRSAGRPAQPQPQDGQRARGRAQDARDARRTASGRSGSSSASTSWPVGVGATRRSARTTSAASSESSERAGWRGRSARPAALRPGRCGSPPCRVRAGGRPRPGRGSSEGARLSLAQGPRSRA